MKPSMMTLDMTRADLNLPVNERKSRRNSISGVQDKVLMTVKDGKLAVAESGGEYILKPAPADARARLVKDIPANEHLTMQIARRVFGIKTAENACVRFADGELAYLTKRFDRDGEGRKIRQEDFCQLAGRSEMTHGVDYKYDCSYEEMAEILRANCAAAKLELGKLFFEILFDYVFANDDAHLKNFSVCESSLGDYILTPAYDLLNTRLHYPDSIGFMALELFKDGEAMTKEFEELGFYSTADFVRLGKAFGLDARQVEGMIGRFRGAEAAIGKMVEASLLSEEGKAGYLAIVKDRLGCFRSQGRGMRDLSIYRFID